MSLIQKTTADSSTIGSSAHAWLAKGLGALTSRLARKRAAPCVRNYALALEATDAPSAPVRILRPDVEEIYWAMAHDIPVPMHMFAR